MIADEGLRYFWRTALSYEVCVSYYFKNKTEIQCQYTCKVGKMLEELAAYLGAEPQDPRFNILSHLLSM